MLLILGRIVDAGGNPVADARIAFSRAPVPVPDIAMLSDASGQFTLSVPVNGAYELTVTADPHPPQTVTANVQGERTNVNVTIPR